MKRIIVLAICLIFISPFVLCEGLYTSIEGFVLPDSLKEIESSAFEGTATNIIKISEGVEYIGERAFSDIIFLKAVYIPGSVLDIGESAVDEKVFIIGIEGSFAYKWSKDHSRHFTVYPTFNEFIENKFIVFQSVNKLRLSNVGILTYQVKVDYKFSPGLSVGEQTYIRISRNTDFRIEGRAPPTHVLFNFST